jgi:exodeoxyribonuclease V beta subunit
MESFDVTDPKFTINQSTLLEASAGTGKTFAIEHLVARLVIQENNPIELSKILVVTFTKAAVRELKFRIHSLLSANLQILKLSLVTEKTLTIPYKYLQDLLKKPLEDRKKAVYYLEQALTDFQEASIFTIHGFCFRILQNFMFEADACFTRSEESGVLSHHHLKEFAKDFLRCEMGKDSFLPFQVELLLRQYRSIEDFLYDALTQILKRKNIKGGFDLKKECLALEVLLPEIRDNLAGSEDELFSSYAEFSHCYKGIFSRGGDFNPLVSKQLKLFHSLLEESGSLLEKLDDLIAVGIDFLSLCHEDNLKKKFIGVNEESLTKNQQLWKKYHFKLMGILKCFLSTPHLLAAVCCKLQLRFENFLDEEEAFTSDFLLEKVRRNLVHSSFVEQVRERYNFVLIDEFQDTDPIQWEIFSHLFLAPSSNCILYLVGDPKQSIYAFRQADIYTYLHAAYSINKERHYTLQTNYRSQRSLVDALNTLFLKSEPLFLLPRLQNNLPYREVKASKQVVAHQFQKEKGGIHFFLARDSLKRARRWPSYRIEQTFFSFIASEIHHLYEKDKFSYENQAILVRDRFQAERLKTFLQNSGIPAQFRRSRQFSESKGLKWMKELLGAFLFPYERSLVRQWLGSELMGWDHHELFALDDEGYSYLLKKILPLRALMFKDSFALFFSNFLHSSWKKASPLSVEERLLQGTIPFEEYHELIQLSESLTDYQIRTSCHPEELWRFLEDLQTGQASSQELEIKDVFGEDRVHILTMHLSKGLEFDIVFALGLINRPPFRETLVVDEENQKNLEPLSQEDKHLLEKRVQEVDAEKMRQLYVSMTRAKQRLYVPIAIEEDDKSPKPGTSSPMELFLDKIKSGLGSESIEDVLDFFSNEPSITYEELTFSNSIKNHYVDKAPCLKEPFFESKSFGGCYVQSYSSLQGFLESKYLPKERQKPPLDFSAEEKTPHTLPAGSETGIFIHKLLEKLPLELCCNKEDVEGRLLLWLRHYISETPYASWENALLDILKGAFCVPLTSPFATFSLMDVSEDKIFREAPFLMQGCSLLEEHVQAHDCFTGTIDMCFEYQEKLYLLDWKSNWLEEGYEDVSQALETHNYRLQASIYKEALKKYVDKACHRNFEDYFGGVFYVFLRGTFQKQGVVHFFPDNRYD